jgi:hypothetical protein
VWQEKVQKFAALETEAISIFNQNLLSRDKKLQLIKDKGIGNWQQCFNLLHQADALDIPDELHTRTKAIISYCSLRLESTELYYKAINENTNQYDSLLSDYFVKIDSTVKALTDK